MLNTRELDLAFSKSINEIDSLISDLTNLMQKAGMGRSMELNEILTQLEFSAIQLHRIRAEIEK